MTHTFRNRHINSYITLSHVPSLSAPRVFWTPTGDKAPCDTFLDTFTAGFGIPGLHGVEAYTYAELKEHWTPADPVDMVAAHATTCSECRQHNGITAL